MCGAAVVQKMADNASVQEMRFNSEINIMIGHSIIKNMMDDAVVCGMYGDSVVDVICNYATAIDKRNHKLYTSENFKENVKNE